MPLLLLCTAAARKVAACESNDVDSRIYRSFRQMQAVQPLVLTTDRRLRGSSTEEVPRVLWNLKVHCGVHGPTPPHLLNPVHSCAEIAFNCRPFFLWLSLSFRRTICFVTDIRNPDSYFIASGEPNVRLKPERAVLMYLKFAFFSDYLAFFWGGGILLKRVARTFADNVLIRDISRDSNISRMTQDARKCDLLTRTGHPRVCKSQHRKLEHA